MNDKILGYQLRISPDQLKDWDKERRLIFLLREDISRPLSVDEDIWPILNDAKMRNDVFLNPELPANGLNVHNLRPGIPARTERGCLIAITASDADASQLCSRHQIQSELHAAHSLDTLGLRIIGFDVADAWFYSGLSNCGFGASKQILSHRFARSLNEYGLFQSQEEAGAFRDDVSSRITDHAPFIVYGLWSTIRMKN